MKKLFSIFLLILLFVIVGCATQKEYVYLTPDYGQLFAPLLDTRPAEPVIVENVIDLGDVLHNSIVWQQAFYDFRDYSDCLEGAIQALIEGAVTLSE